MLINKRRRKHPVKGNQGIMKSLKIIAPGVVPENGQHTFGSPPY